MKEAAARGVAVRIMYNVDHANPIPVPPPPEPDARLIASLGVPSKAIAGVPDLMHHKYVVRDGESVWTGSTNWTDDSWARQENVVVTVDSPELAHAFTLDFEELWTDGDVERERLGRAPAGGRRRARVQAVVHARLRRGALAPDREARSVRRSTCGSARR